MKTSTLLLLAKGFLARNSNEISANNPEYICYSINAAAAGSSSMEIQMLAARLKSLITSRIAPFCTFEDWLEEYHGIKQPNCMYTLEEEGVYYDKLQFTRHAWVRSMIAEFKAKGD